jgi:hypothetical protein
MIRLIGALTGGSLLAFLRKSYARSQWSVSNS